MKVRAFEIAINPIYDGYQRGLANIIYGFCDKKTGSAVTSKVGASVNEVLAHELHNPVSKKLKKKEMYAMFKDNVWAADLADFGSLASKNWDVKYILCVANVFTKYAWVKHL